MEMEIDLGSEDAEHYSISTTRRTRRYKTKRKTLVYNTERRRNRMGCPGGSSRDEGRLVEEGTTELGKNIIRSIEKTIHPISGFVYAENINLT